MATGQLVNLSKCVNCTEKYTVNDRMPKIIDCGHTFCSYCLGRLNIEDQIECPKCQKITKVPTDGIPGIGTNYAVLEMLTLYCESCQNYGSTTCCTHCNHQLCEQCVDMHVQAEYKGRVHEAVDRVINVKLRVYTKFQRFVESIENTFTDCDTFYCNAKNIINDNQLQATDLNMLVDKAYQYTQQLKNIERDLNTIIAETERRRRRSPFVSAR